MADARESLIAGCVPERVVDLLEPVEVDDQERAGAPVGVAPGDLLGELELEPAPVDDTGEGVVVGEVAKLVLDALARVDVLDLREAIQRLAVSVAEE